MKVRVTASANRGDVSYTVSIKDRAGWENVAEGMHWEPNDTNSIRRALSSVARVHEGFAKVVALVDGTCKKARQRGDTVKRNITM